MRGREICCFDPPSQSVLWFLNQQYCGSGGRGSSEAPGVVIVIRWGHAVVNVTLWSDKRSSGVSSNLQAFKSIPILVTDIVPVTWIYGFFGSRSCDGNASVGTFISWADISEALESCFLYMSALMAREVEQHASRFWQTSMRHLWHTKQEQRKKNSGLQSVALMSLFMFDGEEGNWSVSRINVRCGFGQYALFCYSMGIDWKKNSNTLSQSNMLQKRV